MLSRYSNWQYIKKKTNSSLLLICKNTKHIIYSSGHMPYFLLQLQSYLMRTENEAKNVWRDTLL